MLNQTQYWRRYGVAIASVVIALLLMLALDPFLQLTRVPSLLFFGAVTISAFWGGRNSGIVATLLSAIFINFFLVSPYSWTLSLAAGFRVAVFILEGMLISVLVGALHTAQAQLRQNFNQLQATEADVKDLNQALQHQVDQLQTLTVAKLASEDRYRTLIESMDEGFCLCKMLLDEDGTPVDYRFLEVNPVFESLTGLTQPVGKTARELVPNLEEFWFETYGRVALAREPIRFEQQSVPMQRWFDVYAFPIGEPQSHLFGILFTNITARKAVEQERERFLAVSSDLQVVTGISGYFQWVSPAFERILGWTAEEMTSRPWTEFVHPDDIGKSTSETNHLFAGNETFAFENRYRHKDGSYRWFLWNAQPYLEEQIIYGAAVDITDRKQAEVALRESEERAQLAIQIAHLGTWRYHLSTNLVELDERMREMWGEPEDRVLIPLPQVIERIHSGDQERAINAIGAALDPTGSGTYEMDYRIVWNDGCERWVSANGQAQFEGEGESRRVIEFIGTALDITERKQAEANLRLSEDRYRTLANAVSQLMWVNDAQGNIQFFNQQWQEYTGVTDLKLGVGLWAEIIHPDDFQTTLETRTKAIQAGEAYEVECRLKRVDQTYRWHLTRVVPHKDERGQILSWFGTATDIDDRKQIEQEREQLLARERVTREQAEAANRIKDEFLAVISHELRSPLNPILGWSRLLQRGQLDEQKTQAALDIIARNAQIQAQLINDLLDVSRILRGKLSLNTNSVDLVTTIQAALETVRLAAEAKFIWINTVLDPEVGQVSGDPDRLQQVIWNLLSNAVKFTPQGGQVDIRLERFDTDAQIKITDTGKGIHPEFLPHVFERFRQENAATTRQFGGLGLGLALVRYLVEMHGGTVQAESPGEGQGATFTVKLPLIMPHQPAINEIEPSKPKLDLNGIRILVVDDDNSTREFIAFLLELHWANVIAVASADEAIATLAQFKPDLLLSDIGMPTVDGYMLMRQVRSLPPEQGGQIPAIALTAYAGEIDHQQSMAAGFQKHIVKPVEPETLVTAIAELVMR